MKSKSTQIILILLVVAVGFLLLRSFNQSDKGTSNEGTTSTPVDKEFSDFHSTYIEENGSTGTISGIVDISGRFSDESKVVLMAKPHRSDDSEYKIIMTDEEPKGEMTWVWDQALIGTLYDIKAELIHGDDIDESSLIITTAPAKDELLVIKSTHDPSAFQDLAAPIRDTISGTINVSGYVPSNSGVAVYQKLADAQEYTLITDKLPALSGTQWSWEGAEVGKIYDIQAILFINGEAHGTSQVDVVHVTAPSSNEVLRIVSNYTPAEHRNIGGAPQEEPQEEEKVTLSGKVRLNGPIPSFAKVAIYAKDYENQGEEYEKIVDDLNAYDGVDWSWDKAENGKKYHLKARLEKRSNGHTLQTSEPVDERAPSKHVDFRININVTGMLDAPHRASVECLGEERDDKWDVRITMDDIDSAERYHVMVGTRDGRSDVFDELIENNHIKLNDLRDSKSYYVKYAYQECKDCLDADKLSAFSSTLKFVCD